MELIKQNSRKAIAECKDPIKITFENVTYTVRIPTTKSERAQGMAKSKDFDVLKNCTGYANPGQTLFIMGASGAGKTSLMNVLSDRINLGKHNRITGSLRMND